MKIPVYFFSIALLLTGACAPQAELVRTKSDLSDVRADLRTTKARLEDMQRRNAELQKRLDAVEADVKGSVDVQKVMADYGAKTDQLATDIRLLQGRLEENNFRISDLGQKLDDRSFKIAELSGRIDELEARLKAIEQQGPATGQTGTAEKKKHARALEPSEAYRQALNDYNSGNYDLALAGFQNFQKQFPDSTQADGAQYWTGECYYAKKDFKNAIDVFSRLIKTHPKSEKAAGAKLKIGYSYLNLKQKTKGRAWLQKVIRENRGSKEADLAREKLRKTRR